MSRPALEVADIFRDHGAAWRRANVGHVGLDQMKVMSAIERCRTAALGGHVARCEGCAHTVIAYNSCRNRHCPKCQGAAAAEWLAAREADLLPVPYFHVVFTLPAAIANIAYQNKAAIYDILFTTSAETMTTIAADPKHLGARIGITSVLHTWGSALTHHPHVHMIVPGGGISLDGTRWVSCRPDFILPVEVLSCLFRGLFLAKLVAAHRAGRLKFYGAHTRLDNIRTFKAYLAPLRKIDWVVYAKRPFGGPKAVLAYLSRYTHRVAISNRRLVAADDGGVSFRWKDYRIEGPGRWKTMTLTPHEFIRRFLIHVLPGGFHRIRHYGLLASGTRAANIARARELLAVRSVPNRPTLPTPRQPTKRACCRAHAPAVADACSSSRLRARLPAEAPSHAGVSGDQDRHLMMPVIVDPPPTETPHGGRLSPGSTSACAGPQDWPLIAPQILSSNVQSARSYRHPRQSFEPKPPHRWVRIIFPITHAGAKSP
jgi:Putative transposase/Transposase zinc-binding domain